MQSLHALQTVHVVSGSIPSDAASAFVVFAEQQACLAVMYSMPNLCYPSAEWLCHMMRLPDGSAYVCMHLLGCVMDSYLMMC